MLISGRIAMEYEIDTKLSNNLFLISYSTCEICYVETSNVDNVCNLENKIQTPDK